MEGKLIIFSAPSGCGKSTIIKYLRENEDLNLHLSVSTTSRKPREGEQEGVHYFFITPEEFRKRVSNNEYIEYEEVFTDIFYGTLRSQVEDNLAKGKNVVFDIDVNGAMRIKEAYGKRALSIFIMPPSKEALRDRLIGRGTEAMEVIEKRLARAEYEMNCADKFDEIVVNDNLEVAEVEVESLIEDFIEE